MRISRGVRKMIRKLEIIRRDNITYIYLGEQISTYIR